MPGKPCAQKIQRNAETDEEETLLPCHARRLLMQKCANKRRAPYQDQRKADCGVRLDPSKLQTSRSLESRMLWRPHGNFKFGHYFVIPDNRFQKTYRLEIRTLAPGDSQEKRQVKYRYKRAGYQLHHHMRRQKSD